MLCLCVRPSSGDDSAAAGPLSINAQLANIARDTGVPGITFAVFGRHSRRNFAAGYADVEAKIALTPGTRMMGASTGKMLVAVLAYQEVERGRLRYSDKVAKFFPERSAYHRLPGAKDLTIAMLLRHSTGLVDGAVDEEAIRDSGGLWTNERRMMTAVGSQLVFSPGTGFSYSDLNYQLLAAVVESIEGQYFGDLALQRIIRPLQMSATTPAISQDNVGLASGYAGPTDKPQYENIKLPDKTAFSGHLFMNPAFEGGGGGFVTSSPDMARFIYSLFNGKLIARPEFDYLLSEPVDVVGRGKNTTYAAGIFRYQTEAGSAYGHSGLWFGYKTMVLYYPALCLGATMQVNSQIDGAGNDLTEFHFNGRPLTMVETLTALVSAEMLAEHQPTMCDRASR